MSDVNSSGFLLPHDVTAERLADLLGGDQACVVDATEPFRARFFDSFDWRLHARGLTLIQMATSGGTVLRLKPVDGTEPVESLQFSDTPAWPADLADSGLRRRVAELLDMRVLLPLATIDGEVTDLRVMNDDGKTVARMQFLQMRSRSDDAPEPRSLWPRARLMPVKGYESAGDKLAKLFGETHEWPRAPECLLDEVAASVGREPGDYSSKLDIKMNRDQIAIDALRGVFLTLLDTLERNVAGTRANLDSEFLHDLRVATRRTRSALTQVKRVLPDAVVAEFRDKFAWLGGVTGPTRDLDVFLLELPKLRASLPVAMGKDLDVLARRIEQQHADAQRELAETLDSTQFHELLHSWRAVLEADAPPGEPGWFADLPIVRVASRRIWRMYKRVRKDGIAAAASGEAEAMHELRKDCKKLRYLIEFFRPLYDPRMLKGTVKALKELLDILGEFQDKEVQAEHLRALATELDPNDPATPPAVLAIGTLVADALRAQEAAHTRFAASFAHFDTARNRARYQALFKDWERATK